jgi:hypothetical protein
MIWEAGVSIVNPKSVAKIVQAEPTKPTWKQKFKDFLTPRSTYLRRQEEVRIKEEEAASRERLRDKLYRLTYSGGGTKTPPLHLPIPTTFGTTRVGSVYTWHGEPFTKTQVWLDPASLQWLARDRRVPVSVSGNILEKFDAEEWNDMAENEREDELEEFAKLHGLASNGITMAGDPERAAMKRAADRLRKEREVKDLARQMEAHKRKLEQELKEAEEQEEHYEGNTIFGAF